VVVGEVEHVEAGVAGHRPQRRRAAAEVVELGHGRAAGGDGALEVAEGDVGGAQGPGRTRPRVARTEAVDEGARAVAEVDVAHGGKQDGAGLDPGGRGDGAAGADGAQHVAPPLAARAHPAGEATARVRPGGGEPPPAALEPDLDPNALTRGRPAAAERDGDAGRDERRGAQLERRGLSGARRGGWQRKRRGDRKRRALGKRR
jgi:hypothetical protein